mmetsp:Transcript_116798/g.251028  ORF Transcript_116798/g.251028 Transcript_116798/m.251028 type:complete len:84 (-) Transcript_116798:36-287(-)
MVANPWSDFWKQVKRIKSSPIGKDHNMNGVDKVLHGGVFVVQPKGAGIAYQFVEESVGQAAPVRDVLDAVAGGAVAAGSAVGA